MNPGAALALAVLAAALAGCASGSRPDVVATFYPLEHFAERVAGGLLEVESVVKPGVEPHDYEPTPLDLDRIVHARVLVVQGVGFEGWLRTAQEQAPGTLLLVATAGLELRGGGEGAAVDPHTWLDPVLAQGMARNIQAGLAAAYPEHAAAFAANADALVADLQRLDAEFSAGLAQCRVRVAVTNHAAFTYMAARYGFQQVAVALDPDAQPSPQALQAAIEVARAHDVRTIFFEDLVSPQVAQTIAREVGAQTLLLSPIESLPAEVADGDYLDAMRLDLRNLREGLECA